MMKAIIIKEGTKELKVTEYPNGIKYEDIRETVEGLIELTVLEINGETYDFYTNEEFLYLNKLPSLVFEENGETKGLLAGNIFVTKTEETEAESEITTLTDEDIENIKKFFSTRPVAVMKLETGDVVEANTYPANRF